MIDCRLYFCTPKTGKVEIVAQLVEQYTFNVWALGSSPSRITSKLRGCLNNMRWPLFFLLRFYIFHKNLLVDFSEGKIF